MNITDMYNDKFWFKAFDSTVESGSPFSINLSDKATTTTLANWGSFTPRLSGSVDVYISCYNDSESDIDTVSAYLYDGDTVVVQGSKVIYRNTSTGFSFKNVPITAYKKYTMKIKSTEATTTASVHIDSYIVEQKNKYMILEED